MEVLRDVLCDCKEIPEFTSTGLITMSSSDAKVVDCVLPEWLYIRLVRLQTLKALEQVEMPGPGDVNWMAHEMAIKRSTVIRVSSALHCDVQCRIDMFDRMIVEQVRAAIPKECERLSVRYLIDINRKLRPLPWYELEGTESVETS
jgi:hypothetical protein